MLVAKERFKSMIFRYRVLNKIQKMKDFQKESYDFTKANLEIQSLLKCDVEKQMQFQHQSLQSKLKEAIVAKNQAIENLCRANFTLMNIQRENNNIIRKYEDAQG
jgi:hypothetical protein